MTDPVWTEPTPGWDCTDCAPEVKRLRIALADAVKGMERMLPYVSDYRRQEHQLDLFLYRAKEVHLEGQPPTWENTQLLHYARDQIARMESRLT